MIKGTFARAALLAATVSGAALLHPGQARADEPACASLKAAGLLPDPSVIGQPLTRIRIIDGTRRLIRAPETLFDSAEFDLPAFGWNLPNVKLAESFEAARSALPNLSTRETTLDDLEIGTDSATLRLADGSTIEADLVVGADGKKSRVRESAGFRARENGFTEAALVCDLNLERSIGGASVEFHYEHGPFTLVPAGGNRANLVWIDRRETLKSAQASGKEALARLFADKSQHLFGAVELLTPAHMFPLSTLTVDIAGKNGVVLVGEAAHAFPPIGAQGLNLGLRDVADLADSLAGAELTRPGFARALSDVQAAEELNEARAALFRRVPARA